MKRIARLNKQLTVERWELDAISISYIVIGVVIGVVVVASGMIPRASAAAANWTQTDWSGGAVPGVVTTTVTTFDSASGVTVDGSGDLVLANKADWYNNAWSYRRKITFDNTTATLGTTSENLANFPVLIKLDGGVNIDYTRTKDAGEDVRFTDSDGITPLSYEIEEWNESGSSYVWVSVPQIDQESTTDSIYIYYGNAAAADGQAPASVWPASDYSMVYHFDEPMGTTGAGSVNDSTGNTGGTPSAGITFGNAGQISSTANFSSGTGIGVGSLGSPLLTAATTISFWLNANNFASPSRQNPFEHSYGGWGTMTIEPAGTISWFIGSNGANASPYTNYASTNTMSNGNWIYVTITRNPVGYAYRWYINGAYTNGGTYSSAYPNIISRPFTIGDGYVSPFNGRIDEFRVHKIARSAAWVAASYISETNSFASVAAVEGKHQTTGTLVSNVFNPTYPTDWQGISYITNGSGTVTVKARSDNSADMSGASAWATCSALTSGSDPSSGGCVTDIDQYFQYQITLAVSGVDAPTFQSIDVLYEASDLVTPTTNASNIAMSGVTEGAWTNIEPTFTWTAGADNAGGSGLLGYCIALDEADVGTPNTLDPSITAGKLAGIDDGVSANYCPYIVTGTSLDLSGVAGLNLTSGKQYYFSIKAVDIPGNIWTGPAGQFQELASFKYDNTPPQGPGFISLPANFIASKTFTMTWPTVGPDAATDPHSGLAGLQYRIGNTGTWYGDVHNGSQDQTDLLLNDGVYTTDATYDFPNLVEGNNYVFVRAWDNLGNVSVNYVSGVVKINTVAPSQVLNLAVTPTDNTVNSYAFDWDAPITYTGQANNITYCYTVNTLPSASTCNYTAAGDTALVADAFANQPGINVMYVVARDEALNINYDAYSSVQFSYSGSAPGMPTNVDIADISIKTTSSWKLALTWDTPVNVGAGIAAYRVYRSTTATSCSTNPGGFTQVGSSSNSSYVDSGLTQETYYYCIKACDSANNCSAYSTTVSEIPTGKFTEPAILIAEPTVTGITTKRATVNWVTDRGSDSRVEYGLSSGNYFDSEVGSSDQVTSHIVLLNNLNAGTTYFYRAKWTDEDGNTGTSEERTFTTVAAPVVKEVAVLRVSLDSALIRFISSGASAVRVYFGQTSSFGGLQEIQTSPVESTYTIVLDGLEDGTKYFYKINPVDSEGFEYEGTVLDFTTLPRPKISNVQIQEVKGAAQPTVDVSWESNTEVSSIVGYYPEGSESTLREVVDLSLVNGEHQIRITGLQANTRYALVVRGLDKLGNEGRSEVFSFTTATDSRPPAITNLTVETTIVTTAESGEKSAQLIITWDTDEPATSQIEFGVGSVGEYTQRTQQDVNLTYNHLVVISNLTPSQVYHIQAVSQDNSSNEGRSVDTVTITAKSADSAFELVINNLLQIFGFLGS